MDAYEQSKAITTVDREKLSTPAYQTLLADTGDRETNSQDLINYLCDEFKIPRVRVNVADKSRKVSGRVTTKGYIRLSKRNGVYESRFINVYNYTAKTNKVVAIKTFTGTLLHEFMHHYDIHYLKLANSLHTSGFYYRIGDLRSKLEAA